MSEVVPLQTLQDGSVCEIQPQLDEPAEREGIPLVICFHGSGNNPVPAWAPTIDLLRPQYHLLLFNRSLTNTKPAKHSIALLDYLKQHDLRPPYVLLAHSDGGAFAVQFLLERRQDVGGIVLVETGKSGTIDMEAAQKSKPLQGKPLSVIRGNSLIGNWKALELAETAQDTKQDDQQLAWRRDMLKVAEKEDEKLERGQLSFSSNHRYVHLPDCGHNVIRDRPDVVFEEVQWVVNAPSKPRARINLWIDRLSRLVRG